LSSQIVFDISNKRFDSFPMTVASLLFVSGLIAIWLEKRGIGKVAIRNTGYIVCAVALIFGCYSSMSYWDEVSRASALRSGKVSIVEGPVRGFHPMPFEGHAEESFSVDGRSFSYSDYVISSCFNNTASHGGPIREGIYVRIFYVDDDCILRIEMLNGSAPPTSAN
jgi:hypothetical protein